MHGAGVSQDNDTRVPGQVMREQQHDDARRHGVTARGGSGLAWRPSAAAQGQEAQLCEGSGTIGPAAIATLWEEDDGR